MMKASFYKENNAMYDVSMDQKLKVAWNEEKEMIQKTIIQL